MSTSAQEKRLNGLFGLIWNQQVVHFHEILGWPPCREYGYTQTPLSVNLQLAFLLLSKKSRWPASQKSQLEGSQKSIILHFSVPPLVLMTVTHLSQYLLVSIPHRPLSATKQLGRLLALPFQDQQAYSLSLKYVAKPPVVPGCPGLQAIEALPQYVQDLCWRVPTTNSKIMVLSSTFIVIIINLGFIRQMIKSDILKWSKQQIYTKQQLLMVQGAGSKILFLCWNVYSQDCSFYSKDYTLVQRVIAWVTILASISKIE